MIGKMIAIDEKDLPQLKKQKPISLEAERAKFFTLGKDEIGLLDIVLFDGIANSEA